MTDNDYITSGVAEFTDIDALCDYVDTLTVDEARKLNERLLGIRKPIVPPGWRDPIQSAIEEAFYVHRWQLGPDQGDRDWAKKKPVTVAACRRFYDYCVSFGQTPNVGFWAKGQYAYLYLGNREKGIVVPEPERFLRYIPDKDYSDMTPFQMRQQLGLSQDSGLQSLVPAEAESLTKSMLTEQLSDQESRLSDLKAEIDDVKNAKSGELAELRMQMERIQAELEAKKEAMMAELKQKKRELELQKEQMENQIWFLDSQIYAIRCFAGEVVQFARIRTGKNAPATEPVVIYQKLRFLDEELGRLASLYEIEWEDMDLFEKFLKYAPQALDTFAPNERCVTLVRLSRTGTQQGVTNTQPYSNMFKQYEYFHGKTVGIIIRNGENIYLGWTDEDRVNIRDDLIISKTITEVAPAEEPKFVFDSDREAYEKEQKAARKEFLEGIISRSFVYNILQGIVEHSDILPLPDGVTLGKPSEYVVYSMADKWLVDNRFGSFTDIIAAANRQVMEGDTLLTVQRLVPERSSWGGSYSPHWDNIRGRGDRNRTHDCSVSDCTVYKANVVEYDAPERRIKYRFPHGTLEDGSPRYIICETSEESAKNLSQECDILEHFERRTRHVYVSVEKQFSYSGARSNFEVNDAEFINLTNLNSVWLEWAITTRTLGGWMVGGTMVTYAYAIRYLKTALEVVRKREAEEKALIDALDPAICKDPDWPLKLTQWKLSAGVRNITAYQAKRFAKAYPNLDGEIDLKGKDRTVSEYIC